MNKKILSIFFIISMLFTFLTACVNKDNSKITDIKENTVNISQNKDSSDSSKNISIDENGEYSTKKDVALYIHIYGKLPKNFITKSEAKNLGWEPKEGNLWDVAEGKIIGGDKFKNREGILPSEKNRIWYECDIDYNGGYRTDKRIVFSNDGLIYYTQDHYKTFTLLYGEN